MNSVLKFVTGAVLVVGGIFVLGILMAFPIMWMWNYVMPDVFGLPEVSVWQTFWGSFMIRLIFSGINVSTNK